MDCEKVQNRVFPLEYEARPNLFARLQNGIPRYHGSASTNETKCHVKSRNLLKNPGIFPSQVYEIYYKLNSNCTAISQ